MPSASELLYLLVHPQQLRAIIQWKVWHNPVHERNPEKEEPTLRRCFELLNMTSRSFSAVIQELHPELLVPVALFYLALRGLDTIEDDMTIPLEKKTPLLRNFDKTIEIDGWTFNDNGPNEKDRQLLVEFDTFILEFKKIKPAYRTIIKDITKKMGNGMADYAENAEHNINGVETVKDYDLYCHYVAGLVGEGLTRLFVEADLANKVLLERPHLHESMGLFLQKTNIIRDVHEDWVDKRRFWPKEIWSKHVEKFDDLFDPKHLDAALNCSSELVLNSLQHADECLLYLAGIREQSVFNFCAIPQSMSIASLDLVFRNPDVFKKHIKINKGDACQLMTDSTQNLRVVCDAFRKYARKIHKKNTPKDPNYMQISIACGKIEQFIETIFPSQDPKVLKLKQQGQAAVDPQKAKEDAEAKQDVFYLLLAVIATTIVISIIMLGVAWLAGARFDLAFSQLKQGKIRPPSPEDAQQLLNNEHPEL